MQGLRTRPEVKAGREQTGDGRESPHPTPLRRKGGHSRTGKALIRRKGFAGLAPRFVDGNQPLSTTATGGPKVLTSRRDKPWSLRKSPHLGAGSYRPEGGDKTREP
jgi:hypothetical protein